MHHLAFRSDSEQVMLTAIQRPLHFLPGGAGRGVRVRWLPSFRLRNTASLASRAFLSLNLYSHRCCCCSAAWCWGTYGVQLGLGSAALSRGEPGKVTDP